MVFFEKRPGNYPGPQNRARGVARVVLKPLPCNQKGKGGELVVQIVGPHTGRERAHTGGFPDIKKAFEKKEGRCPLGLGGSEKDIN